MLGSSAGSALETGHGYATICLAAAALDDEDLLLRSLRDAVSFARASTMWITLYAACEYGGEALIELGHPALGAQLIGAATPHRSFTGAEADRRARALDTARGQLDEAAYTNALRFAEHLNPTNSPPTCSRRSPASNTTTPDPRRRRGTTTAMCCPHPAGGVPRGYAAMVNDPVVASSRRDMPSSSQSWRAHRRCNSVAGVGIEVVASDATFGATVHGVALAHVTDAEWQVLLDAFHTYGVLVFHDQHVRHDEQIAFSRRLGALEPVGRTAVNGVPDIVRISNLDVDGAVNADSDSAAMRLLIGNMDWHADSSFRVPPARASMLSCERPSSTGGETEFADMRAAFDALGDDVQRLLDGRLVTHSYLYSQGAVGGLDSLNFTTEQRAGMGPTERPVIDVHPVTGRRALCIGRHAYRLSGMADDDAHALLDELLADACRPPRVLVHRWRAGDLVWWDNRCVLHRARPWDYAEPRIMWHTRIAGETMPR